MKVKTNFVLRVLMLVLFFGSFSPVTEAQTEEKPVITNLIKICDQEEFCCGLEPPLYGCEETTVVGQVKYDRQGNPYIEASLAVYCVDLEGPFAPEYGSWPEEEYPICLKYEYANGLFRYTDPITVWKYVGDTDIPNTEIHRIYRGDIPAEFNYDYNCSYGIEDNSIIIREVSLYSIISEGNYAPFVLDSEGNGAINGIFSCEVFDETCHFCRTDCPGSDGPVYDISICTECLSRPESRGREYGKAFSDFHSLTVNPNPFSSYTEYSFYASNDSELNIRLFSASGVEVIHKNKSVESGHHTFSLNTEQLSEGVFYLHLSDGKNKEIARIIKMK